MSSAKMEEGLEDYKKQQAWGSIKSRHSDELIAYAKH